MSAEKDLSPKKCPDSIIEFAKATPFSVQQVADAVDRLNKAGLDSSERILRNYCNAASALGKGLADLVESIVEAANGPFERIGLDGSVPADKISGDAPKSYGNIAEAMGKSEQKLVDAIAVGR